MATENGAGPGKSRALKDLALSFSELCDNLMMQGKCGPNFLQVSSSTLATFDFFSQNKLSSETGITAQ